MDILSKMEGFASVGIMSFGFFLLLQMQVMFVPHWEI